MAVTPATAGQDPASSFEIAQKQAAAWLAENWGPRLTVRRWWAGRAESGWGSPQFPEQWFGRGLPADAAAGVRAAFTEAGALGPPPGDGHARLAPLPLAPGGRGR